LIDFEIGNAREDEARRCPEIEARASERFSEEDLPAEGRAGVNGVNVFVEAAREDRLWIARLGEERAPVGFALVAWVAGELHLAELDVLPEFGRRGLGRALLESVCGWARAQGESAITLSTFRDVPWNAPFYASAGFGVLPRADWSAGLEQIAAEEARHGLDPARRVMMRRRLR